MRTANRTATLRLGRAPRWAHGVARRALHEQLAERPAGRLAHHQGLVERALRHGREVEELGDFLLRNLHLQSAQAGKAQMTRIFALQSL